MRFEDETFDYGHGTNSLLRVVVENKVYEGEEALDMRKSQRETSKIVNRIKSIQYNSDVAGNSQRPPNERLYEVLPPDKNVGKLILDVVNAEAEILTLNEQIKALEAQLSQFLMPKSSPPQPTAPPMD